MFLYYLQLVYELLITYIHIILLVCFFIIHINKIEAPQSTLGLCKTRNNFRARSYSCHTTTDINIMFFFILVTFFNGNLIRSHCNLSLPPFVGWLPTLVTNSSNNIVKNCANSFANELIIFHLTAKRYTFDTDYYIDICTSIFPARCNLNSILKIFNP